MNTGIQPPVAWSNPLWPSSVTAPPLTSNALTRAIWF
jgi:hypothetical protein